MPVTAERVVNVDELEVLFNLMDSRLTVSFPLLNLDIASVVRSSDGVFLKLIVTREDLHSSLAGFDEFSSEMPLYSDIRGCLLSSGVLDYANADELRELIGSAVSRRHFAGVSLDTNLLYNRFVSNFQMLKENDVILASTLRDEIMHKINRKMDPRVQAGIKNTVRYQKELCDELWNRETKSSRIVRDHALREFTFLKKGGCRIIEGVERSSAEDGENDKIIVRTLADMRRKGKRPPLLITADAAVEAICDLEDVEYFRLHYPDPGDAASCAFGQFRNLVHSMSSVFGAVMIGPVLVLGEYRGKKDPEDMKLRFQDPRAGEEFSRELGVCRKLNETGIVK